MSEGGLKIARDFQAEDDIKEYIGERWNCTVADLGDFGDIDWLVYRDNRIVAIAEFKRLYRPSEEWPNLYFNLKKWIPLMLVGAGLKVPAYFIVQFDNKITYIDVADVDATKHEVNGRDDRGRSSDLQPAILVPVNQMKEVK